MSESRDFVNYFAEKTWNSEKTRDKVREFKSIYEDFYLPNFHLWSELYAKAYRHMAMYMGDQQSSSEVAARRQQRRNSLIFNHVFRTINTIAGYFDQSQLGYSVQSISPDEESTVTADILNDCLRRVCYQEDVYGKISTCVRETCITGWSGLRAYVDPSSENEIKVRNLSWSNMVLDPWMTQKDLSDCGYIAVQTLLPRAKLAAMYPDREKMIMTMTETTMADYHFPWSTQSRTPVLDRNRLNYTEMYRMVARPADHIYDPSTGELILWNGDEKAFKQLKIVHPKVEIVKRPIPVIEYGVMIEKELVVFDENPYGCNCYPIQPFFAIFEPSFEVSKKIGSLVGIIEDSQRAYNKRKNALLDILDTNLQSGVIYKDGAVLNPESLYMIRAGHNICLDRDASIHDSIQQVSSTEIPASLFQATQDLETNINTLLGVNPEMFGQTEGGSEGPVEMSGVLYRMKQASAMTGMQPFFSSIREGQRLFGNILLKMIQANYSPEKMAKISKKEPTLQLYNEEWTKFNIVVQEGLIENRNANLEQKLALRQLGIPISTRSILEDAPVYGKNELIQYAEEQEQVQGQLQQLQIEKEKQAIENLAQDLRSEAAKNQAQALDILSSIGVKTAEKEEAISRAQKIKAETVERFAEVLKKFAELPQERIQAAMDFMAQMTSGVEQSVDEKKVLSEIEADEAIAMRLPAQDLAGGIAQPEADFSSQFEPMMGGGEMDPSELAGMPEEVM